MGNILSNSDVEAIVINGASSILHGHRREHSRREPIGVYLRRRDRAAVEIQRVVADVSDIGSRPRQCASRRAIADGNGAGGSSVHPANLQGGSENSAGTADVQLAVRPLVELDRAGGQSTASDVGGVDIVTGATCSG